MEVWWLWVVACKFARCDVMVQRPRWRQCGGSGCTHHESTGEETGRRAADTETLAWGIWDGQNAGCRHAYLDLHGFVHSRVHVWMHVRAHVHVHTRQQREEVHTEAKGTRGDTWLARQA